MFSVSARAGHDGRVDYNLKGGRFQQLAHEIVGESNVFVR